MNPDFLISSYTVAETLDPLKDELIRFLYNNYEDTSILTPKETLFKQQVPGVNLIIGEPPIIESKHSSLGYELKVFSKRIDLIKKNPEDIKTEPQELFTFLDSIVEHFKLKVIRIGCVLTFRRIIEKDILSNLYNALCPNSDNEEIVAFTVEKVNRFSKFYNLVLNIRASKEPGNNENNSQLIFLTDSNTIPAEKPLNEQKEEHQKTLSQLINEGWQKLKTLINGAENNEPQSHG